MIAAWLAAIGAGLASALLLALPLAGPGGVLFTLLVPLPLFAVGLGLGLRGAMVGGAVLLALAAAVGGAWPPLALVVVLVGPVWLLVRQALLSRPVGNGGGVEWYPPGLLISWLAACSMAWLLLAAAVFAGHPDGMAAGVREEVGRSLRMLLAQAPEEELSRLAESMAGYALGVSIASWMMVLAINAVLAQGALARFGRNLRPSPELARLELPRWLLAALAGAALAALAPGALGFLARNALPGLLLPYFFLGLAVLHTLAGRMTARMPFLIVCYAILVVFTWPALLLAGLGLIEQWARLRRRLRPGGRGKEDE